MGSPRFDSTSTDNGGSSELHTVSAEVLLNETAMYPTPVLESGVDADMHSMAVEESLGWEHRRPCSFAEACVWWLCAPSTALDAFVSLLAT